MRLQELVKEAVKAGRRQTEIAEAIRKLHGAIWDERPSGTEYGDALVAAGFEKDDRHEMAAFPLSASSRIAFREMSRARAQQEQRE